MLFKDIYFFFKDIKISFQQVKKTSRHYFYFFKKNHIGDRKIFIILNSLCLFAFSIIKTWDIHCVRCTGMIYIGAYHPLGRRKPDRTLYVWWWQPGFHADRFCNIPPPPSYSTHATLIYFNSSAGYSIWDKMQVPFRYYNIQISTVKIKKLYDYRKN